MARFLIDEDLPRSIKQLLIGLGHEAVDVRDVGLQGLKDSYIARYAQQHSLCLLTGDFDFADIRNYPPSFYHGIVVLTILKDFTATMIMSLLKGFISQSELIKELSGKLIIVESTRIRIRRNGVTSEMNL